MDKQRTEAGVPIEAKLRKAGGGVEIKGGGGRRIHTLAYADDIVLMSEDEEGMKRIMGVLREYVRRKGLTVNVGKTKIMRRGKGGGEEERGGVEMGEGKDIGGTGI